MENLSPGIHEGEEQRIKKNREAFTEQVVKSNHGVSTAIEDDEGRGESREGA